MDKFRIKGGDRCRGAFRSAAPELSAALHGGTLLTSETVTLHNLPYARDIITMPACWKIWEPRADARASHTQDIGGRRRVL